MSVATSIFHDLLAVDEAIGARPAPADVIAASTVELVAAAPAVELVVADPADQDILSVSAVETPVVVVAPNDPIRPRSAEQRVAVLPTGEHVVAEATVEEHIDPRGSPRAKAARGADDVFSIARRDFGMHADPGGCDVGVDILRFIGIQVRGGVPAGPPPPDDVAFVRSDDPR